LNVFIRLISMDVSHLFCNTQKWKRGIQDVTGESGRKLKIEKPVKRHLVTSTIGNLK